MTVLGGALFLLIAMWLIQAALATLATWRHWQLMAQLGRPGSWHRAVVIVPIKGAHTPSRDAFIAALAAQSHPRWRLIVTVESEDDPAVGALETFRRLRSEIPAQLIVAGPSVDTGQKVWNHLRAIRDVSEDDELVVFADADMVPAPEWLAWLDRAAIDDRCEIVTGYRLLTADNSGLIAEIVAAANLSIAVAPRPTYFSIIWGGTMAMGRQTFERLDLNAVWQGTLTDDVTLSVAARSKGVLVHTRRGIMPVTPYDASIREALAFMRRQCTIIRLYDPALHTALAAMVVMPVVGMAAVATDIWRGGIAGLSALFIITALLAVRLALRDAIVRRVTGHPRSLRAVLVDGLLRPLWWPLLLLPLLAAVTHRRFVWAGITYDLQGPRQVRVIARDG